MIITNKGTGFGSCNTVTLLQIIEYFNKHKFAPNIDRSSLYKVYGDNVYSILFNSNDSDIEYNKDIIMPDHWASQWQHYKTIPFNDVAPFINKYFYPSDLVVSVRDMFWDKYNINFNSTIGVFYRGNDKQLETKTASYNLFIDKCKEIKNRRKDIKFLVQPDETEFLEVFMDVFPDTIHITENEHIKANKDKAIFHTIELINRESHVINFFASMLIHSMCSEIVTGSGNIGLWLALYRGNSVGIHQIYNDKWYK